MKTLSLFLLSLFLIFEVLSAQDVCQSGHIFEISESLLLSDELYLFMKNGTVYYDNSFQWNGTDFNSASIVEKQLANDWTSTFGNTPFELFMIVDYPPGGPRILIFHWMTNIVSRSIENWVSQVSANWTWNIESFNINDCYPVQPNADNRTVLWCSIFTYTSLSIVDLKTKLKSLLHFPDSNGQPSRMIRYNQTHRTMFKQELNVSTLQIEWQWEADLLSWTNLTNPGQMLSVTPLTKNKGVVNDIDFDMIEIVDNDFSVYRMEVTNSSKSLNQKKSGQLKDIVCPTFVTTMTPNATPNVTSNVTSNATTNVTPNVTSNVTPSTITMTPQVTVPQDPPVSGGPPQSIDICNENNGDFQILEAVHWNDVLFLLSGNSHAFQINPFKWDGHNFTVGDIESAPNWGLSFDKTRLIFSIKDPITGPKVVFVNWHEDMQSIPSFNGKLIGFDKQMKTKTSEESLELNIYKCNSNPDRMRLCTLFSKFPEFNIQNQMLSISSFPLSDPLLPQRLFVYYKETPTLNKTKECPDCYKSKRHLLVSRNQTISNVTEPFWTVDNATGAMCVDLKGVIVNASTSLTDYISESGGHYFDSIEFLGSEYQVIRISIQSDSNVAESVKTLKSGKLRDLLNCMRPHPMPEPGDPSILPDDTSAPPGPTTKHPSTSPQSPNDNSETTPQDMRTTTEEPKGPFPIWLIILLVLIVLLLIALFIWLCCFRNKDVPPEQPVESTSPPAPAPAPVVAKQVSPKPSIDTKESDSKPTAVPSIEKVSTPPPPTPLIGSQSSAPPKTQINLEFPDEPKEDELLTDTPSTSSLGEKSPSVRSALESQPSNE